MHELMEVLLHLFREAKEMKDVSYANVFVVNAATGILKGVVSSELACLWENRNQEEPTLRITKRSRPPSEL